MPVPGYKVRKAAQTVAFFAIKGGGTINVLKVTKLVYLADREFMEKYDSPILYDRFVSMPHGPVNSLTLDYINGCYSEDQASWDQFISGVANYCVGLADENITLEDLDELSEAELEVLEGVWDRFGNMDKYVIRDYTHEHCPEWEDPNGSSAPIPYTRILKFLKKENPEYLAKMIQEERRLFNYDEEGAAIAAE